MDREHLTNREGEVLRLVADGLPNKAVAQALGVSGETVKDHLKHIYAKLSVQSRTEAAAYWFREHDQHTG
jgi:DNA-binding CsgD family transcriptional regulator